MKVQIIVIGVGDRINGGTDSHLHGDRTDVGTEHRDLHGDTVIGNLVHVPSYTLSSVCFRRAAPGVVRLGQLLPRR